ncbi:hypothetical protein MP228_003741 [Amoeboaphelidium protococcarum]|nr:hypothetical protein MP228_003741 [Amoeboaphelidium protococcarum]
MSNSVSSLESSMKSKIQQSISPLNHLEIHDVSGGCGTSFELLIVSPSFEGKNTLARHRLINSLLETEIKQMHAFSQRCYTPSQYEALKN